MNQILMGALAMGFAVAGVFFLCFWRKTRDRLFALFALAFFVMAGNRIGLGLVTAHPNQGDSLYWVRLIAFTLILVAILDKNWSRKPSAGRGA